MIKIFKPFLKVVISIQALGLFRYTIGKLWILIFLKHRGFVNFPIIKGFSLWDPSAFAHKAIERRSLFFLRPEIRFVASVRSGSNL